MQQERPRKLQRISQACDLCHRRSIRCRPSNEDTERCQNCYDFDVACTYDRPSKRRKHPQAPTAPQQSQQSQQSSRSSQPRGADNHVATNNNNNNNHTQPAIRNDSLAKANDTPTTVLQPGDGGDLDLSWKAFALSSESVVFELFDAYMEIVYPLYPFFHEATEKQRLKNRDHLSDRGFFASVMAACALSSARIRDGALPSRIPDASKNPQASSEVFFAAAKSVFTADLHKLKGADYIRACALLALTSIQYGQSAEVQQHLGVASTLVAMQRFYDEKFWPVGLADSHKETYRRLYWSIYSLEVYAAVVWNCFLRTQEIHANVRYPNELEDGKMAHSETSRGPNHSSWLVGWNFTIDLYRVLEHVLNKARAKRFKHDDRRSVDHLVFLDAFSEKNVMTTMLNMYYGLPPQFKATPPMTGDQSKDIFAFQAANIQAVLQLLRMMLFSTEDGPGVDRKCDVANEVLSVFQTIPTRYLRAISTPLICQLGTIGQVLGSVFENPLQQATYERVRGLLVLMSELLEGLESNLHRSAGASQNLLSQVEKIDQYMRSQQAAAHPILANQNAQQQQQPGNVIEPQMTLPMSELGNTPTVQIPVDLALEWPWPLYQEAPYYLENY